MIGVAAGDVAHARSRRRGLESRGPGDASEPRAGIPESGGVYRLFERYDGLEPKETLAMRNVAAVSFAVCLAVLAAPLAAQDDQGFEPFSPEQLDNLLAPVALYPDPLLAQVLLAATFPDQVDEAARFVRWNRDLDELDGQPWDVNVRSVAHYPEVIQMMADKLDWTTALGQAYVYQSTDVMASVQRLRAQAQAAGNLVSTPEMQVVASGGWIELWPAQPQYLWVPEYDPAVVFFARAPLFFGVRLVIGAWLNCDLDWRSHRVFYHGWEGGPAWVERSRPYVHVTNVYINNTYRDVRINREVVRDRVNYRALDRYDDVHHDANFDRFRGNRRVVAQPPPPPPSPPMFRGTVQNKVIRRNIDTSDPRLNEFRGHVPRVMAPARPPDVPAFTPAHGAFDPGQASRRGQVSRGVVRTAPSPPPAPHPPAKKDERRHP